VHRVKQHECKGVALTARLCQS